MKHSIPLLSVFALLSGIGTGGLALAATSPSAPAIKDLNTPREFPAIDSRKDWEVRATAIGEQALVSCGLWPMPEKTPLRYRVFDRVERDGYTVEKVWIQTLPGFYLGGNLYRPLGKGKGPFPGVLNPHGHWRNGRLADEADGSVAGRCITQARLGMVAFTYDMLGYNDTFFPDHGVLPPDKMYLRHRRFATNQVNLLWNISQMGLQTWNSIRALDFLRSLPDVDAKRLACTGESGGGTQTFMLGAIDDRLAFQAPIVMVSHTMQGGCSCENAPGLRVRYSNMEIAAAAAPRPQFLVAATGDWTRQTLTVEGPAIAGMYRLLKAENNFGFVRFDYNHNYNQTSREAVYGWLAKFLLGRPDFRPIPEPAFKKEPDTALFVWPDGKLPDDAKTEPELTQWLVDQHQSQLEAIAPHDKGSLNDYRKLMTIAWKHTLQTDWPLEAPAASLLSSASGDTVRREYSLQSTSPGRRFKVSCVLPRKAARRTAIIATIGPAPAASDSLTASLLERGFPVVYVDLSAVQPAADPFANFFYVYNRTTLQERVGDLLAAAAFAREELNAGKILLIGQGAAGLYALMAAPAADSLVADCNSFDPEDDHALLQPDLFCPGLKRMGAFEGAALLAATRPVLLHNTGSRFSTEKLKRCYTGLRAEAHLAVRPGKLGGEELEQWVTQHSGL